VLVVFALLLRRHLGDLEAWLAGLGPWAPAALLAFHAVAVPLFFPVSVIGVTAGALFGFWGAVALLVAAGLLTGTLMYGLGRWALAGWVQRRRARSARVGTFLRLAEQDSVRIMVLLRLSPLHYGLINYAMGAGRVRFWPYFWTTVLVLPSAALQAYVGAAARRLGSMSDVADLDAPRLVLGALGLVALALLLVLVGAKAKQALEAAAAEPPADRDPERGGKPHR